MHSRALCVLCQHRRRQNIAPIYIHPCYRVCTASGDLSRRPLVPTYLGRSRMPARMPDSESNLCRIISGLLPLDYGAKEFDRGLVSKRREHHGASRVKTHHNDITSINSCIRIRIPRHLRSMVLRTSSAVTPNSICSKVTGRGNWCLKQGN